MRAEGPRLGPAPSAVGHLLFASTLQSAEASQSTTKHLMTGLTAHLLFQGEWWGGLGT